MEKRNKPESSRLNLFYILQVLSSASDDEHPLSVSQIRDMVNQEFGYLSSGGSVVSYDTVKRTLEELTDKIFPQGMDPDEAEARYGYSVICVMKKGNRFIPYRMPEEGQAPKQYYYYEGSLKTPELLLLKDAVETYSYFSEEDITDIIGKLVRFRPRSFPKGKYFDHAREEREEDSRLLVNIEELIRIIRNRNLAEVTYCCYNWKKKLVPRKGYPKILDPLYMMWSNGYYYLLVYHKKYDSIVNMRIDRITDIREVETDRSDRRGGFNPVQYRHEHPVMFGGEKEKIVVLCRDTGKNYIMNTVIDVFGKHVKITPAGDELLERYLHHDRGYYQAQGITWYKVVAEAAVGGVELWATQYCSDCHILSPKKCRERVKNRIAMGMEYYS